ncbi:MAG: PIN domain-containing protein [Bacteroidaceae bacterium]|nr:PIN domain-containing protein [Bacteroidaceae bacterium]
MAKYIIDTNTCIEYFKHRNGVPERMDQESRDDLCVSEVTIAELLYGAVHSKSVDRHLREVRELQRDIAVLPISDVIDDYADIRHALTSQGINVEDFDILIGATARHYGLIVVTDNLKHFSPMPDVEVENWIKRPQKD